jgi:G3E family GTPase
MPVEKVPATVLTGYLGAGKTTLLNRILTAEHGKKIAVIVNEFGEIGIDQQLIIGADEEIFEMNNGCICCSVRGDLIRIISDLMQQRERFEHIVIETTGLADPSPVVQTFFVEADVQTQVNLDSVLTVVDAKHIYQHWEDSEAQEQIAFADTILLNKIDLVTPPELAELEAKIRHMNALGKVYRTQLNQTEFDCTLIKPLLEVGGFDLQHALDIDPDFLNESAHEHDESVYSVAIVEPGSVDSRRLHDWLKKLLQTQGQDIFRMKGILNIAREDYRFVFQGVHMLFDGTRDRLWKAAEPRVNQLVFIGRNLDEAQLRQNFKECLN